VTFVLFVFLVRVCSWISAFDPGKDHPPREHETKAKAHEKFNLRETKSKCCGIIMLVAADGSNFEKEFENVLLWQQPSQYNQYSLPKVVIAGGSNTKDSMIRQG
jgi:hypothetical protein